MTDASPIQSRRFTLDDGLSVALIPDVVRFALENDLPGDVQLAIGDLQVGEELLLGGGAAATFTLKRTA